MRYVSMQSSQVELLGYSLHQRAIVLSWYDMWIDNNSEGKCKSISGILPPFRLRQGQPVFWPQSLTFS
jgi:hypothetical protein